MTFDPHEIAEKLTRTQRAKIRDCQDEFSAGDMGWITSHTTVAMRILNNAGVLVERNWRGSRNVYSLTLLGKQVRAVLQESPR